MFLPCTSRLLHITCEEENVNLSAYLLKFCFLLVFINGKEYSHPHKEEKYGLFNPFTASYKMPNDVCNNNKCT